MLLIAGSIGDAVACAMMLLAWWMAPVHHRAPGRRQWLVLALLFAALAVEKALQLDARVHDGLRALATRDQVYGQRREVQVAVVLALTVGFGWALHHLLKRKGLPVEMWRVRVLGLMLLGLDAVRAVSLHQIDHILFASVGRIHLNHVIEGGLTLLLLYNTVSCMRGWKFKTHRNRNRSFR